MDDLEELNIDGQGPNKAAKRPLVLFDMDGTLLKPDSWRENGVGYLYEGVADLISPFVDSHRCGLLTGCEVYRVRGAFQATDSRLERWLATGHFFCEMGLVQLIDGVKKIGGTQVQREMLEELRNEMQKHYALFPGSEVMVTLTPRYELNETIEGLKEDFLLKHPNWADRLTITTSTEAVDLIPKGFTKANGIDMARSYGYYPIHFIADSWGDMEALERIRDSELGLAALVGQAKDDVKDRWAKGHELHGNTRNHVQLTNQRANAVKEFFKVLEERFPGEY
ncbi:MAG: hypothetical protein QF682_11125 [Candidatus Thermoplasmatota archaeon]|jgi:hypothetical protein|nr:hypothetical protein [Candidatus Thermoplasmatota archaeon]